MLADGQRRWRIGVILDGWTVSAQALNVIAWLRGQPDIDLATFARRPGEKARRGVGRIVTDALLAWERARLPVPASLLGVYALKPGGAVVIDLKRSDRHSADRLAALSLDLLVDLGRPAASATVDAAAAGKGMVSVDHAGGAAGLREVFSRDAVTAFAIRWSRGQVSKTILTASIPTQPTLALNRLALEENAAEQMVLAIRRVLDDQIEWEGATVAPDRAEATPSLARLAGYGGRRAARLARRAAEKVLGVEQHWDVSYLYGDWRTADPGAATAIVAPPGVFIADPFAHRTGEGDYVFVEEYPYATRKGVIAVYRVDVAGATQRLGVCLEEEFHLSYPFVFRCGGELYMCPETGAARQVRLYRCVEFPMRWAPCAILLDGVAAVDSDIFARDGRWWMLTSWRRTPVGGHSRLHAYHADHPRGPWHPIAADPALVDGRRGRNGGLLTAGGDVFRVSQEADFGRYGSRVAINRIVRLDSAVYKEETVRTVEPVFGRRIEGTHHLHNDGDLVVFDHWSWRRRLTGQSRRRSPNTVR